MYNFSDMNNLSSDKIYLLELYQEIFDDVVEDA